MTDWTVTSMEYRSEPALFGPDVEGYFATLENTAAGVWFAVSRLTGEEHWTCDAHGRIDHGMPVHSNGAGTRVTLPHTPSDPDAIALLNDTANRSAGAAL